MLVLCLSIYVKKFTVGVNVSDFCSIQRRRGCKRVRFFLTKIKLKSNDSKGLSLS